ncbi:MAG: hypothetical protein ACXU87_26660 [Xanthobacteraceae bacterium]
MIGVSAPSPLPPVVKHGPGRSQPMHGIGTMSVLHAADGAAPHAFVLHCAKMRSGAPDRHFIACDRLAVKLPVRSTSWHC